MKIHLQKVTRDKLCSDLARTLFNTHPEALFVSPHHVTSHAPFMWSIQVHHTLSYAGVVQLRPDGCYVVSPGTLRTRCTTASACPDWCSVTSGHVPTWWTVLSHGPQRKLSSVFSWPPLPPSACSWTWLNWPIWSQRPSLNQVTKTAHHSVCYHWRMCQRPLFLSGCSVARAGGNHAAIPADRRCRIRGSRSC